MAKPPALPNDGRPQKIEYELFNSGLSHEQFNELLDPTKDNYVIIYKGDFRHLDFLFQQLSCAKDKHVKLSLMRVDVDNTVYLPFSQLGPGVEITFMDTPKYASNFYNYIVNLLGPEYGFFTLHSNLELVEQLNGEREIQLKFLKGLSKFLHGQDHEYSKDELMDLIFDHVKNNYKYDNSITGNHGEYIGTSILGATAYGTYNRGMGICEGRSKLIKLYANNNGTKLPCYLVGGYYGDLGHMWNEYIDEHGNIIEYDASYGTKCRLEDLPYPYVLENHELDIIKHLRKTK